MNKKTFETKRLWNTFKKAKLNGQISDKEYQNGIVLLIDKMSVLTENSEKIDELLNCLENKIKSQNYDLIKNMQFVLCFN